MKKYLIPVIALFLAGCEDIPGQLKVFSDLKVISKGKEKTVSVGQYSTSLDFKKNRIVATIVSADDKKIKLDLNVPEDVTIPQNGPFTLTAAQSGQPFDIKGAVDTKRTRTEERYQNESCQVEYYDTICTPQGCTSVPRYRQGYRQIRFYDETIDQKLQFTAFDPSAATKTAAQFDGAAAGTRRVVTYQGQCF